jgi:predicted transcriptional regulator
MAKETTTASAETHRWQVEHIRRGLREAKSEKFVAAREMKKLVDRLRRK